MEAPVMKEKKIVKWLKKIGFWGFLFFLVKGLVWLALGYLFAKKV